MFVREVLSVVTPCVLDQGLPALQYYKNQFESSCFRSRAGIIKRLQVTVKKIKFRKIEQERFDVPFYLHIFGKGRAGSVSLLA
jgi:hypothetical protein